MAACECGNLEFSAHQQCYLDVIVDEHGEFMRNPNNDAAEAVYESSTPYGPFTCEKCGKEYNELTDLPEEKPDVAT